MPGLLANRQLHGIGLIVLRVMIRTHRIQPGLQRHGLLGHGLRRLKEYGLPAAGTFHVNDLGVRELEVFQMLGQGNSVRQIAESLELSIPTINSFRNRIKEKLNLKSSTEVMLHAVQWLNEQAGK